MKEQFEYYQNILNDNIGMTLILILLVLVIAYNYLKEPFNNIVDKRNDLLKKKRNAYEWFLNNRRKTSVDEVELFNSLNEKDQELIIGKLFHSLENDNLNEYHFLKKIEFNYSDIQIEELSKIKELTTQLEIKIKEKLSKIDQPGFSSSRYLSSAYGFYKQSFDFELKYVPEKFHIEETTEYYWNGYEAGTSQKKVVDREAYIRVEKGNIL